MILEDTRGPHAEIHGMLVAAVPVETTTLGAGDYAWYDVDKQSVGVERKSIPDLLASLRDGRLGDSGLTADGTPKDELVRMKATYDHPMLLVEGMWWSENGKVVEVTSSGRYQYSTSSGFATMLFNVRRTQWNVKSVLAALWSYTRYLGVELWFTGNPQMTAELLLQGYISDQAASHGEHKASRRYQLNRLTDKQDLFSQIPGIGVVLAKALDNKFGSVVELTRATKKELQAVLGEKKGAVVYDWLRQ